MLPSKPYREPQLASMARLAVGEPPPKVLKSGLSPSAVHQSEFRCGGNPQAFKRSLETDNFRLGWSAAFVMRRRQGHFGGMRSLAGGGESDRRSDTADAVQETIGFGNMLGDTVAVAGHVDGRDDGVCDFALERGRKAVSYDGQAGFELIGVHVISFVPLQQLPRQALNASEISRFV
jgi:hypothetical protein